MVRDIAKGLQQLHGQDIVHLNMKPCKHRQSKSVENLLVDSTGRVKISDLGRAQLLPQLNHEILGRNVEDARYHPMEVL